MIVYLFDDLLDLVNSISNQLNHKLVQCFSFYFDHIKKIVQLVAELNGLNG